MRGTAVVPGDIRAVLFDVDGTLYSQTRLRGFMAAELGMAALRMSPARTRRLARALTTFRRTREDLRALGHSPALLDELQITRAAEHIDVDPGEVRAIVEEWIYRRPLRFLRFAARPGLGAALASLRERGVRIGALSDYPVAEKLAALGVADYFSIGLCTADPAINAFKPHPRGFWHACEIWGVAPEEVLYVGDRPEIDGAGAAAAGIRCVIIGGRHPEQGGGAAGIRRFDDLAGAVTVR